VYFKQEKKKVKNEERPNMYAHRLQSTIYTHHWVFSIQYTLLFTSSKSEY